MQGVVGSGSCGVEEEECVSGGVECDLISGIQEVVCTGLYCP